MSWFPITFCKTEKKELIKSVVVEHDWIQSIDHLISRSLPVCMSSISLSQWPLSKPPNYYLFLSLWFCLIDCMKSTHDSIDLIFFPNWKFQFFSFLIAIKNNTNKWIGDQLFVDRSKRTLWFDSTASAVGTDGRLAMQC